MYLKASFLDTKLKHSSDSALYYKVHINMACQGKLNIRILANNETLEMLDNKPADLIAV
jgi:hypothetical protein